MRRIAITGMGIASCLGNDLDTVSASLRAGRAGIRALPDHAVRRQALLLLERPYGPLGCRTVAAVHRHAHQRRIKLR